MSRAFVVLIACSLGYVVIAHPHCHYDLRAVDPDGQLTFCSMDYAPAGTCCTAGEEAALESTLKAAGSLTAECADYYQQMLCGVCGTYSGHLYERLVDEFGTENGLTMKNEFCTNLITACDGQIDFPDYDGVGYCTIHAGGGETDLFWSYPYEDGGIFDAEFTELFPDLPDSDLPDTTVAMHQSPDGSMYWIVGQEGVLMRVDVAESMTTSTLVMDLSGGAFYTSLEEGFLNFAFSPMFDTNGYFYVSWTVDEPFKRNRLSKFQYYEGDPDSTRDSEEVLVQTDERPAFIHNGGWLGFKPVDYGTPAAYHDLYWAIGDAGPQTDTLDHGQRTDIHFGSMVRISVPSDGTGYQVPSDNYPNAVLPEICAIGLRNTWKCSFDRLTNDLYCGDVGQILVESIKNVECGNNYGWRRFEGSRCTSFSEGDYGSCADADRSDLTPPFFEYCHFNYDSSPSSEDAYTNGVDICGDRSIVGNSVIGGYVYRGQAYADLLYGAYVFGDYTSRNIYYILQEDDGTWKTGTIISDRSVRIYSFSEDINGELFIIDSTSTIYHMPCGDVCENAEIPVPAPAPNDDDYTTLYGFIGCYGDRRDRILSGLSLIGYSEMTTEFCAGFCLGSAYFGTQDAYHCFCGKATDDPTMLGEANCNDACGGDSSQTCGGVWASSVYEYTM